MISYKQKYRQVKEWFNQHFNKPKRKQKRTAEENEGPGLGIDLTDILELITKLID